MVIPSTANVTFDALVQIQNFAKAGLTVILSGGDPGYYPSRDGRRENATRSALASLKKTQNVYSVAAEGLLACLSSLGHQPRVQVQTNGTWRPLITSFFFLMEQHPQARSRSQLQRSHISWTFGMAKKKQYFITNGKQAR
jgi:hypothetical protein